MRGLISGIKRMEIHDGDGLRTTVFFKGCPLSCIWCHNPESIDYRVQTAHFGHKCIGCGICKGERTKKAAESCPADALVLYGREYEAEELCELLSEDCVFFSDGGGVTLSGGECLSQADFATETAKILHQRGISVYIDTCGYVKREVLERIIPYVDKFLYDIKAISPDVHKKCTGKDNALILDNLRFLCERGCNIEIRYPLVVGHNDAECEKIGRFLSGINGIDRIKVLRYHSLSASRYEALGLPCTLPDTETTYEDVERAVRILRRFGLDAVNGESEA